jgi:hypothetical protein
MMMSMSLRPIDIWYHEKQEPARSCLQFLRQHILQSYPQLTEAWKYGMPFFCYQGKMVCYLWLQQKTGWPYLGIVNGNKISIPGLIAEKRARMKIWLIDPTSEIPLEKLNHIVITAIALTK